jgi:hypothetical protein
VLIVTSKELYWKPTNKFYLIRLTSLVKTQGGGKFLGHGERSQSTLEFPLCVSREGESAYIFSQRLAVIWINMTYFGTAQNSFPLWIPTTWNFLFIQASSICGLRICSCRFVHYSLISCKWLWTIVNNLSYLKFMGTSFTEGGRAVNRAGVHGPDVSIVTIRT